MSNTLQIQDTGKISDTSVTDIFIDQYMPPANGEFVKIYLYILRMMHNTTDNISLSSIADVFSCTEKDVLRALTYWQKMHVLNLEFDDKKQLTKVTLLPLSDSQDKTPGDSLVSTVDSTEKAPASPKIAVAKKSQSYLSPGAIQHLKQENPDIGQLLFLAEQYLKKTLTATDMQKILYFYDELHFPVDLIEYLIEYCVSQNHRSMNYIEKVGLSWHEEGVHTVEAAKQRTSTWSKDYFKILKAFGIRSRDPIDTEVAYMSRWLKEYGFSFDIIKEACSRTIAQTAQPNFKYAEGILSKWSKEGVKTIADIQNLDELHLQRVKVADKGNDTKKLTSNKFNNFTQREYDYASLEKQLLNH